MLSPMQFGGIDPVGSSRIGSLPNPRRNTSKEFFEAFWSGKKAEIFFLFISTLFPLLVVLDRVEERRRKDISAS